ncbi:hypothetical protein K449DRAFT_236309 [Hypoxylon sp. EC38]|nr:hypothetical protein K449DRAFT_236309 [Hypoxylon sp. EC38]
MKKMTTWLTVIEQIVDQLYQAYSSCACISMPTKGRVMGVLCSLLDTYVLITGIFSWFSFTLLQHSLKIRHGIWDMPLNGYGWFDLHIYTARLRIAFAARLCLQNRSPKPSRFVS